METNYSVLFYLKKPKGWTKGPAPIYMRITINGEGKEVSTGRKCEPGRWCSQSNREKGSKESTKLLNIYLDEWEKKVEEAHTLLTKERKEITAFTLKQKFTGNEPKVKVPMLMELFSLHNKQMEELLGIEFEENTLKGYKTTHNHLTAFINARYSTEDVTIHQLDFNFINGFSHYLKTVLRIGQISVAKYIKHLKKIVNNFCIKTRLLDHNPFVEYKNGVKPKERQCLTQEELDHMVRKVITIPRLDQVRDIFIFCCYTGLSYADVKKLRQSEIVKGVDGKQWILTTRKKNGSSSRVPLLEPAIAIIEKYRNYPPCANGFLVLPVLSNQKMNAYLKEIADLCEIAIVLTFHIARHTFATTVMLSNGVPIETVGKMLGHSLLTTTQHYAKIVDVKVSLDTAAVREKYAIT
ncbi:Tyrosine recombinase XerD [compost metagenome]|uniref:site-specific integrase n=1 Tax=Sphingobacterium sp. 18053 TaxID=2681401 RepID=UPI000F9F1077|nr:site-specific integrase [Sphingobacterium sp. 18053]